MLPLAGSDFPAALDPFLAALRGGLARLHVAPRDLRASGAWPRLDELTIDLTGARMTRATEIARAHTEPQASVFINRLAITAAPLIFESTPLHLDLRAESAEAGFARDAAQHPLLQLTQAAAGTVVLEAKRADLETALARFAGEALAKQGAEVKSAKLDFTDRGSRTLEFRAEVSAKVFVMNAQIVVTGALEVNDELHLRLHGLTATGDGMIANLATGYLRPRFAEIEKRTISLAAFSFAGVKLHDIRLTGGDALRLEARFGG